MIDKGEVQKYKSIKAPESLKQKIISKEEKNSGFSKNAIFFYAAAALLFLVLGVSLFAPSNNFDLYYGDDIIRDEIVLKISSPLARTVSTVNTIDIPLKTNSKVEALISKGDIETLDGNSFIVHVFESDLPVILTINQKTKSHTYSIFINDKNEIVLSEIK